MKKIIKNQSGFTLVEMLMVVFISMIIVIGATGIYVYSTRAQQKTLQLNVVAQDTQFLFDTISRKMREGEIDYSFYNISYNIGWNPEDEIAFGTDDERFIKTEKEVLAIYNDNPGNWVVGGETYNYKGAVIIQDGTHLSVCFCDTSCSDVTCGSRDNPFIPLTADSLKVNDLEFKISPASSPFDLAYNSLGLEQPHMTMLLNVTGAGENLFVQQTVPQRFIERK